MSDIRNKLLETDYFNPHGLVRKAGIYPSQWNKMIVKELCDNALDSIEANSYKQIDIEYINNSLSIFDNGKGISIENLRNDIYNFTVYSSSKAHIASPSRGKLGNALMCIIGLCYQEKYELYWHTSEGEVWTVELNSKYEPTFEKVDVTTKRGIQIVGIEYEESDLAEYIPLYSICNPDVKFTLTCNDIDEGYDIESDKPMDKSPKLPYIIDFFNHEQYLDLLNSDENDQEKTYKSIIDKYFGDQFSRNSGIVGERPKLKKLSEDELKQDFLIMRNCLKDKPYTILRKHLLYKGKNLLLVEITNDGLKFPCFIEFDIQNKTDVADEPDIYCFINNSITYDNGDSIDFEWGHYKIHKINKEVYCNDLNKLLKYFKNYNFYFHFICPNFIYRDMGKTQIWIDKPAMSKLVDALREELSDEEKERKKSEPKKIQPKKIAMQYMTKAFEEAAHSNSTDSKYRTIHARQLYYKLREMVLAEYPDWENNNTYNYFTQRWLQSWFDDDDAQKGGEKYEDKIHFDDRGIFEVNNSQFGIGTTAVLNFETNDKRKNNAFRIYGGSQELYVDDTDFSIRYKYKNCIYIEKTGFAPVFREEKVSERYNAILAYGKGQGTRAAKKLLKYCHDNGLNLYCFHDYDYSGVSIFNALCKKNNKFKFNLKITDLGVNKEFADKFGIKAEEYELTEKKKKSAIANINNMTQEQRAFFHKGGDTFRRYEMNAFTTQQLIDIMDEKLLNDTKLPTIEISKALSIDEDSIIDAALMRVAKIIYSDVLKDIDIPKYDMTQYDNQYTLAEAKKIIEAMKEDKVDKYAAAIMSKIKNIVN